MPGRKKGRIRYGKLFAFIFLLLCLAAGLAFGLFTAYHAYEARYGASAKEGKTDYYLIIGADDANPPSADTVVLGTVNEKSKQMSLIFFPSDTAVGRSDKEQMMLKDVYAEGGVEETKSAIENLLHIRIDHFAVFTASTLEQELNHIGSQDLYVEKDMSHTNADGTPDIRLSRGYQTLDSSQAIAYMRYADNKDDQIGRIQRQQRYLKTCFASLQKNMSFFNWTVVKTYWAPYYSDMTGSDAASVVYDVTGFPAENCHFFILPGEKKDVEKLGKAWVVNPVETQKVLAQTISQ